MSGETPLAYIPIDWRLSLSRGETIPERLTGAALFADISGFTPLTESLARQLGARRGAEELTVHLNRVYDALIAELYRYGGSVIGFSGDAITCWLDGDDGNRATAAGLAMQAAMAQFAAVTTPTGEIFSLGMKAAVSTGGVRRFLVGDPDYLVVDTMAGRTLEVLVAAEGQAERGEVVLSEAAVQLMNGNAIIAAWRTEELTGERFAVVSGLREQPHERPWPELHADTLSARQIRAWLLPPVYERLSQGQGEFLAELRPAVALFLRFTGIDYDRDEEAPKKLDLFVREVEQILTTYEGSLIQLTIGDKGSYLYAAFGAPIAHEDDASRACTAALDLLAVQARLAFLDELQIGITEGRMRTGAYGGSMRRTYGSLGDAVNLAARLMSKAKPGQILVSEAARRATGRVFDWAELPPMMVKGKSMPIEVSALLGRKRLFIGELHEPQYALPMVGRQQELALLAGLLEGASAGRGQIVAITADAGMGKSRLAAEVVRMATEQEIQTLAGECPSYGTSTSYLVWRSVWRGLFELDARMSSDDQQGALAAKLEQLAPELLPRLPLLAAPLNLPLADNSLTAGLAGRFRKSSLESLLVGVLQARSTQGPLLLLLDDTHWIDPLSEDLVEVIGRAIAQLPVMLLMLARPEEQVSPPMTRVRQLAHFTEVLLTEFTPDEAEELIQLKLRQFFGSGTVAPPAVFERLAAQAAGNPFYIEELLNYLQELGIDPQDVDALVQIDLPNSLHSLILSRMDQLTENEQITLKVASVVGRLFAAAMLWGVYPALGDADRVRAILDRLSELDLMVPDSPDPELTYLFKHVMTQQVAYESLLYSTRARLHEEIGKYMEENYAGQVDQYLNLLAFHYEHSENDDKKRVYLLRAAQAAQHDYANEAAIGYYEKVMRLLPVHQRMRALRELGAVLELVGRWDEADRNYDEALRLAEQENDRDQFGWIQVNKGSLLRKRGQFDDAVRWLEAAQATFESTANASGIGAVLHALGSIADQRGDYERAEQLMRESLAIRQQLAEHTYVAYLLGNLGIVARRRGRLQEARKLYEESLALRRELGDRWGIANVSNNLGNVMLDLGEPEEARRRLEEAVRIHRELGDRWNIGNALNNLGNVVRSQEDYATARALYTESLTIYRDLGDRWALAYLFEDVGWMAAKQGQGECALRLVAAAAALREAIRAPLTEVETAKLQAALAPAVEQMDTGEQERIRETGRAMSLDEAIAFAIANPS